MHKNKFACNSTKWKSTGRNVVSNGIGKPKQVDIDAMDFTEQKKQSGDVLLGTTRNMTGDKNIYNCNVSSVGKIHVHRTNKYFFILLYRVD